MKTSFIKLALFSLALVISGSSLADSGTPRSGAGYLFPYAAKTYSVRFYGGSLAKVSVHTLGYDNVDMYIYDQYGRLRCYDASSRNKFTCRFYPRRTGWHTIRVVNRSAYRVRYGIATN